MLQSHNPTQPNTANATVSLTPPPPFSPRAFHIAQQARALAQLQHLPVHAQLTQIANHAYQYGAGSALDSPLTAIYKLGNGTYQAHAPLPQIAETKWHGDCISNIALAYNSLPAEIKRFAWVENLYFGTHPNLMLSHVRLGVLGLSQDPLYLDHSHFFSGLNLQYAQRGAPLYPSATPGVAQAPATILDLSQGRICSEFSSGENSYITTIQISDKTKEAPTLKCSAYEQNAHGFITQRFETSASIPVEPQLMTIDEFKSLAAFEFFKSFNANGAIHELSQLPDQLIQEQFARDFVATYNGLVRALPSFQFQSPSWKILAGDWKI